MGIRIVAWDIKWFGQLLKSCTRAISRESRKVTGAAESLQFLLRDKIAEEKRRINADATFIQKGMSLRILHRSYMAIVFALIGCSGGSDGNGTSELTLGEGPVVFLEAEPVLLEIDEQSGSSLQGVEVALSAATKATVFSTNLQSDESIRVAVLEADQDIPAHLALDGQSFTVVTASGDSTRVSLESFDTIVQLIGCSNEVEECRLIAFGVSETGAMEFNAEPGFRYIPITQELF